MFRKALTSIFLCILLGFYVFPVSLSFLPETLNTKMILAVLGAGFFVFDCGEKRSFTFFRTTLSATVLAVLFSVWCYFCTTINGTDDSSYTRYWLSFATWLGGAYAVCFLIKRLTGRIGLGSLTAYLAAICTLQCIIALIIDNVPSFQMMVDRLFVQGQEYLQGVHRLYGIGASLDSAGVRFSVVLVMIAHQLSRGSNAMGLHFSSMLYLAAFVIITIIGSIIARTTWVGSFIGLVYIIVSYAYLRNGFIDRQQIAFVFLFTSIILIAIIFSVWAYRTNSDYRNNLRFAFEGFFNWFETGTFRTDSTDKLNRIMWIWPKDLHSWLVGTGYFGLWTFNTDIGYCRFTLYCGLIGLIIFSVFFIHNGLSIIKLFPGTTFLSIVLIALTFIIWIKVATDIFFIYALLFSTARERDSRTTTRALS